MNAANTKNVTINTLPFGSATASASNLAKALRGCSWFSGNVLVQRESDLGLDGHQ